jgi:hypothetical protein
MSMLTVARERKGAFNLDKIHLNPARNQLLLESAIQEQLYRLSPIRAVIQRALIHVQADELIRLARVQVAAILHRVREAICDRCAQQV